MKTLIGLSLVLFLWAAPARADDGEPQWNAADTVYGPAEMAKSRRDLRKSMGGQRTAFVQVDRLEYQAGGGDVLLWDAQGWYGGHINKAWIKSEGEFITGEDAFEEAEIQALYSRAVTPFFDLQAGLRHDFAPGEDRTFAAFGVQGLAPYWLETDFALFLSGEGEVSARLEVEYELLLTQRLILQPRTELDFAFQDTPARGIGAGLSTAELGARLRYEIKRQFAPYIGVAWSRAVGTTADFVRAEGEDPGRAAFVAGLRLWF